MLELFHSSVVFNDKIVIPGRKRLALLVASDPAQGNTAFKQGIYCRFHTHRDDIELVALSLFQIFQTAFVYHVSAIPLRGNPSLRKTK